MRSEKEILNDLEKLCQSPGYAHTIAFLCFRDNIVHFKNEIKPQDLDHLRSSNRLIRTEISTLIGLMVKSPLNLTIPTLDITQKHIEETECLLKELHGVMLEPFISIMKAEGFDPQKDNPFKSAALLREAIFYGAESAYSFQYRDFCIERYQKDNQWLVVNKGFKIEEAIAVIEGILAVQNQKLHSILRQLSKQPASNQTLFPSFTFSLKELTDVIPLPFETVRNVIVAFSLTSLPCNKEFCAIGDFNLTNARPIIPIDKEQFILFQGYSIMESVYESPFYWMVEDKDYFVKAKDNRGEFAENFSEKRLKVVFGEEYIFKNLRFVDKKGEAKAEIDVLVTYADRAIILQAKSKRLTIEARKGNDNALQKDFKDAIQRAYNQGWKCANHLLDGKYSLIDKEGNPLSFRKKFKEIFIFCVVADHYPSLSFQAHHLLEYKKNEVIRPPYVMDIFFLDVMAEFLNSPLYFLSFAHKRSEYFNKILSSHETTTLAFHLKKNLWLGEYDVFMLEDDIAQELDVAMMVRRDGISGNATPKGILTNFMNKPLGKLIEQISNVEHDGALDLGFFLLELSEETANETNFGIKQVIDLSRGDNQLHDFSVATNDTGLTVHCSYSNPSTMLTKLRKHCEGRKYIQKANRWFGIGIHAFSERAFDIIVANTSPWEQSDIMDEAVEGIRSKVKHYQSLRNAYKGPKKRGRNELCPCGSRKKYKKCCL